MIPRAIDWFTGEALQFEELDDDMEEGDFEDEDDEEDDDLSEDHDDEDESDDDVSLPCLDQAISLSLTHGCRMMLQSQSRKLRSASKAKGQAMSQTTEIILIWPSMARLIRRVQQHAVHPALLFGRTPLRCIGVLHSMSNCSFFIASRLVYSASCAIHLGGCAAKRLLAF